MQGGRLLVLPRAWRRCFVQRPAAHFCCLLTCKGGTASSRGTGRLQGDSTRSKIPSELHLGTCESCCPAVCIPCKHLTAARRAKTHHHHLHSVVGTAHAESRGGPSCSWKLAGDIPALCRSSGLQPRGSALGLGAGWLPAPLCSCVHRERSAGSRAVTRLLWVPGRRMCF